MTPARKVEYAALAKQIMEPVLHMAGRRLAASQAEIERLTRLLGQIAAQTDIHWATRLARAALEPKRD